MASSDRNRIYPLSTDVTVCGGRAFLTFRTANALDHNPAGQTGCASLAIQFAPTLKNNMIPTLAKRRAFLFRVHQMKAWLASQIRRRPALKAIIKPITTRFLGRSQNEIYDINTSNLLAKYIRPSDNCVDVGCHAGEIMDELLKHSPNGQHYGFEPLPLFYDYIQQRYARNPRITLHRCALSHTEGETEFVHIIDNPGYSGILQRHLKNAGDRVERITVQLRKLDDLIPADVPIRLIKIDVEGAEYGVLLGAKKLIGRDKPYVLFEYGRGAAEVYGTLPSHIFAFFDDLGYNLFPLTEGEAPIASAEELATCFETGLHYYFFAVPAGEVSPWGGAA